MVFIFQSVALPNNPTFEKEEIQINILGEDCIVIGHYYFKNHSKEPIPNRVLYYPFPVQPDLPYPDSIAIFDSNNNSVPFSKTKNGVFFKIHIPPLSTVCYKVKFHQPTPNGRYEYILTTTQMWKKPLSSANFVISIPKYLYLTHLSLDFNKIEETELSKNYFIYRKDFYPTKNLIVEWETKK